MINTPVMKVKKMFPDAKLPVRNNPTDSGADVFVYRFEKLFTDDECYYESKIKGFGDILLHPSERVLIHTGIAATVGKGYEIQVRPRSSFALKQGLTVLNTPGTIDEAYRGMIGVIIVNNGFESVRISIGDKIAQLVVSEVCLPDIFEVESLDTTERNEKGFGSSGTR
jgi:dUTP pyrophosphatase